MNIIQITPGAGNMICGACLRDSVLVRALRELGHSVTLVPLYLPLSLEEPDEGISRQIFYNGVSVYLDQKSAIFRRLPRWFHRKLATPFLLKQIAQRAATTKPQDAGPMTVSMLRGENGHQAKELEELLSWLKTQTPDLICLSNVLLAGLVRRLKTELRVPVVCSLQGEDSFLDALPEIHRQTAWALAAARAQNIDLFIAPSQYYAKLMGERLGLSQVKLRVVPNGIDLKGYASAGSGEHNRDAIPVVGFFARMCREKGLDSLVRAFIQLNKRGRVNNLRLRVGGYCSRADQPFVARLRADLELAGVSEKVEFFPNITRSEKLYFLQSLSVFSVPASYPEAFGLYVLEALASGIPVVQPNHAAFPELLAKTGGGRLFKPGDIEDFSNKLEELLLDPVQAQAMGGVGQRAVFESFGAQKMAEEIANIYRAVREARS